MVYAGSGPPSRNSCCASLGHVTPFRDGDFEIAVPFTYIKRDLGVPRTRQHVCVG